MQVKLGRAGDYAVRAVLDLARHYDGGRRKARQIAEEMDIPRHYLPQILANLVRTGLLTAAAGPDGGYTLARPPAEITLLDVVEAAEGPIRANECLLRGGPCDWERVCPLHVAWAGAEHALADRLAATTFAELSLIDEQIEGAAYPPPPDAHAFTRERRGVRSSNAAPPGPPDGAPREDPGS